MKPLLLVSALLLTACSTQAPKLTAGKGAIYGVLTAEANSAFREKGRWQTDSNLYGTPKETVSNPQAERVNYAALDELYVGLLGANVEPQHYPIHVSNAGMSPRSVALAVGDKLQVYNDTDRKQTFFISQTSDIGDGIQSFPALAAGSNATYPVQLVGTLELLSEDDGNLKANLLAQKNMAVKRLKTGETYQFENLNPGQYGLIFWYWRLGKIEQKVEVKVGENVRIDKTLSVDSIMRSR